jgi:hypothetical protein
LVKTAKSKNWKLEFEVEYIARKMPQQNSYAETSFTIIAAQDRCIMIAGKIPNTGVSNCGQNQLRLMPVTI